jgi:hypothetical protein
MVGGFSARAAILALSGRLLWSLLGVVTWTATVTPASANEARKAKITMRLPALNQGDTQIDGGTQQLIKNWQATLKYFQAGKKDIICTATLVGERTILTAAHCLPQTASVGVEISEGEFINLECKRHPKFNRNSLTSDIALCFSEKPIEMQEGLYFENINIDARAISVGQKVFLLGFGCRNIMDTGDRNLFGQLYGGFAKVSELPPVEGGHILAKDGVVICPGDSGGAAYIFAGASPIGNPRSVFGVSSGYYDTNRVSAIAPFTAKVATFVRDWSRKTGAKICGVHLEAKNCRIPYSPT